MNLNAEIGLAPLTLSGGLGAGHVILNDWLIGVSRTATGHRLSLSRGNEEHVIDIPDGEKGDTGVGIASARMNADSTLTLSFTDGRSYTTPSLRGDAGSSAWSDITGKPESFPPGAHVHAQNDISGLGAALTSLADGIGALGGHMTSTSAADAGYHLGFYIDAQGDLCQTE